ncbi:CYTH and CHAD domain-containing protein [Variovorax fucosicus]|uniref:CYTH and CHAD domain-containing protein n=1 Tax=Variovorax fucosicus TaxID=3053517 RepID=UPI0025751E70|nr:CYTH and CHAD domain-containing protein [Variovorax sp. J22G47]MDM0055036.1 CYTH and CHAD domain-containing protein [Variovorax sp. J22G47]
MEIEFKFCIPPARLAAVEAAVRRGAVVRTRLQARYFDTADRALASSGIVLRLRKEGRRWVQTVKAAGDGPLHREEHNVDLGVARAGVVPAPDAQRHHGTPVGERLVQALAGAPLAETYATDIWRLTRDVRAGGSTVELALDLGKVVAHAGTSEARESPVCELELELKRGPVAGLVALAQRWAQQHGLWFSTVSKAERGERLLAGLDVVPAVKALPPRFPQDVPPDGPAVQRAVVASCLAQMLPNASEIAAGSEDEEQVHQLRIGIRRLRTALRELSELAPSAFDAAWEPPLVDAFRALGALRDRVQVVQRMAPQLREAGAPAIALPAENAPAPPAGAAVRAPAFQAVLVALIGFTAGEAQDVSESSLNSKATLRLLRKHLQQLHAKTVRDGKRFETLAAESQHRARKRLKRLRYLGEFVAPLFAEAGAKRYLARLGPAQDALGEFNDEAVASALYRQAVEHDPGAWFAVGWFSARRPAGARACRKALGEIAAGPRFWKRRKRHGGGD